VLHTGDIKLDQLPLDGRLTDLAGFSRLGDEASTCSLVDSTNADVPGFVISEREIGPVLEGRVRRLQEPDDRGCFASHVHRCSRCWTRASRHRKVLPGRPLHGAQHGPGRGHGQS